ncbi:uncharacterized protein LOC109809473 [Cajanus cajan]|nr:uncharacterized protein LOC109809473 [Cajanus cajan]
MIRHSPFQTNQMNTRKLPISPNTSPVNFRRASPVTRISARKLAARLWHLRFFKLSSKPKLQSSPPRVKRDSNVLRDSVVSLLLSELLRAQTSLNNLKAQHKSFRKEHLLWKRRQLKKNDAVIEALKDKLARERRSRERMESLNAKLAHDLAQAMLNYVQEKRKRQLTEQVCNQLAMQIGEDKAKLQGLQRYSIRIRQEMEQERNMFHMAELWREESIQMKLLDAKLALEDKFNQMIHLFKQATDSCDFTKSNDVLSVFEELEEKLIQVEPYYPSNNNLIDPSSTVHIVNLDEDYCLNNNPVLHQSTISINEAECCENAGDGCYKHCDSVAQQNLEGPRFGECEGRVATSSGMSGGIGSTFMCKGSCESGFRQWELLGQGNFADTVNPHITRGIKGCIEWPRGIPKINAKVIPLEERVRRQKSQLQHILKPQGQG